MAFYTNEDSCSSLHVIFKTKTLNQFKNNYSAIFDAQKIMQVCLAVPFSQLNEKNTDIFQRWYINALILYPFCWSRRDRKKSVAFPTWAHFIFSKIVLVISLTFDVWRFWIERIVCVHNHKEKSRIRMLRSRTALCVADLFFGWLCNRDTKRQTMTQMKATHTNVLHNYIHQNTGETFLSRPI